MASNKQSIINKFKESGMTEDEAKEAYTQQMREKASNAGKVKSPTKGFGHPTHDPAYHGKIGGRISRRRASEK